MQLLNDKHIKDRKCPICGKMFFTLDIKQYQWKFNGKKYCSYTCMRVDEKKYLEEVNKNLKGENLWKTN